MQGNDTEPGIIPRAVNVNENVSNGLVYMLMASLVTGTSFEEGFSFI